MIKIIGKHRSIWTHNKFVFSTIFGLLFFLASLALNYVANNYAFDVSSNSVSDILLDNLPLVNTEIIFVEGSLAFVVFVLIMMIREPKIMPYVLKSTALFVIIRAIFVTLTHLGPFPQHIAIRSTSEIFHTLIYSSGADLFFSGHTGLPFLFALMFWRKYYLRVIFLISSLIAAASVLMGHMHYSIDVAAAFFITYGIFHMSLKFFREDHQVFLHGPEALAKKPAG